MDRHSDLLLAVLLGELLLSLHTLLAAPLSLYSHIHFSLNERPSVELPALHVPVQCGEAKNTSKVNDGIVHLGECE